MADKQINELPSGGALQDTDLMVLQRAGAAYNVLGSQIAKQSDMDTAESDIDTLQSDLATAEDNISTLQSGKLDKTSMQTITLTASDTIKAQMISAPTPSHIMLVQNGVSIADAPDTGSGVYAVYVIDKMASNRMVVHCYIVSTNGIEYHYEAETNGTIDLNWQNVSRTFITTSNATSFTIRNLRKISSTVQFRVGLLYGCTGDTKQFLFMVFCNVSNNVICTPIFRGSGTTITFTGTIDTTNNTLTLTGSETVYGGIRLLWVN